MQTSKKSGLPVFRFMLQTCTIFTKNQQNSKHFECALSDKACTGRPSSFRTVPSASLQWLTYIAAGWSWRSKRSKKNDQSIQSLKYTHLSRLHLFAIHLLKYQFFGTFNTFGPSRYGEPALAKLDSSRALEYRSEWRKWWRMSLLSLVDFKSSSRLVLILNSKLNESVNSRHVNASSLRIVSPPRPSTLPTFRWSHLNGQTKRLTVWLQTLFLTALQSLDLPRCNWSEVSMHLPLPEQALMHHPSKPQRWHHWKLNIKTSVRLDSWNKMLK